MSTARDRKRRIHALLSRWETIRFANSEKECVEDFAAMIVDLEDRLAQYRVIPAFTATPAPLDVLVAAKAVVDAWEETVTATVISRTNWAIERLRYALAAAPAPLDVDRAAPFGDRISADLAQEASPLYDPEYMCPNCVTPWKCNGPHIPEE